MPSPRQRTHAAEYAAHLAAVRSVRWRLGLVDGPAGPRWRVARREADGWWEVLDSELVPEPDEDPVALRRRRSLWLRGLLGVRSIWLTRDYDAAEQGREAYEVEVQS